ncbi:hypothetical protein HSX11_21695 [Oxalobacteraceae bacterium]|nr:hypothetical protein [Oxalobacteraceae bacterium]
MKPWLKFLACACGLLASASALADAHYSFKGFWPGQDDTLPRAGGASFELTLPEPFTVDTTIQASQMSSCQILSLECQKAFFIMDAAVLGIAQHHVPALALSNLTGLTTYYYFDGPAYTSSGSYANYYDFHPSVMVSVVPELSSYQTLLGGLLLLAGLGTLRRRQR